MALGYRYTLERQENGWWLVRFPGIPEALTEGETEEEADDLINQFEANVPRPAASDLIFHPREALGRDWPGRELSPEEVVDYALSYRPIAL